MNAPTPDTPHNAGAATPAAVPPPQTQRGPSGLVWLALLLGVNAQALTGLLWQRLAFTQEELARRARDAVRNDSYAARIIDLWTGNAVGAGITTRWSDKMHANAWRRWSSSSPAAATPCSGPGCCRCPAASATATTWASPLGRASARWC